MHAIMDTNDCTALVMSTIATQSRAYITTTLYDLISAMQNFVEYNDDLVVAMVQGLINSGRLTWGA